MLYGYYTILYSTSGPHTDAYTPASAVERTERPTTTANAPTIPGRSRNIRAT